ncbi:MAG: hypothetical protein ACYTGX_13600 [Planctomycetota bacterium]|jgi:hypothetical protein
MNNRARTALHWIRTQQREFWLYHGGAFVAGLSLTEKTRAQLREAA